LADGLRRDEGAGPREAFVESHNDIAPQLADVRRKLSVLMCGAAPLLDTTPKTLFTRLAQGERERGEGEHQWNGLTSVDAKGKAAWERWLSDHEVVRGALVVLVTACVLIPLAELLAILAHKVARAFARVRFRFAKG
jgi:hypothetical protein